jgi:hypothetical protein
MTEPEVDSRISGESLFAVAQKQHAPAVLSPVFHF